MLLGDHFRLLESKHVTRLRGCTIFIFYAVGCTVNITFLSNVSRRANGLIVFGYCTDFRHLDDFLSNFKLCREDFKWTLALKNYIYPGKTMEYTTCTSELSLSP